MEARISNYPKSTKLRLKSEQSTKLWLKIDPIISYSVSGHLLTTAQRYDAKHRIECPECDRELKKEEAKDQVHIHPLTQRSVAHNYPVL